MLSGSGISSLIRRTRGWQGPVHHCVPQGRRKHGALLSPPRRLSSGSNDPDARAVGRLGWTSDPRPCEGASGLGTGDTALGVDSKDICVFWGRVSGDSSLH